MDTAKKAGVGYVCVTGGEPMLQEHIGELLNALITEKKWTVSLETNGSVSLKNVPGEVVKVVDVKLSGSGEGRSFLLENLSVLNEKDELKFVVTSEADFHEAVAFIQQHYPTGSSHPYLTLSPAAEQMPPDRLAELLMQSGLTEARLQLQLHKILWGDEREK